MQTVKHTSTNRPYPIHDQREHPVWISMGAAVKVSRLLLNDIDCNFWTLAYFCLVVIVSDLAAVLAGLPPPHSSDFGDKILHALFSEKQNHSSMATCSVKGEGCQEVDRILRPRWCRWVKYRVNIQAVPNLPLTSRQKLGFSMRPMY